jgi:hypothetical protein
MGMLEDAQGAIADAAHQDAQRERASEAWAQQAIALLEPLIAEYASALHGLRLYDSPANQEFFSVSLSLHSEPDGHSDAGCAIRVLGKGKWRWTTEPSSASIPRPRVDVERVRSHLTAVLSGAMSRGIRKKRWFG